MRATLEIEKIPSGLARVSSERWFSRATRCSSEMCRRILPGSTSVGRRSGTSTPISDNPCAGGERSSARSFVYRKIKTLSSRGFNPSKCPGFPGRHCHRERASSRGGASQPEFSRKRRWRLRRSDYHRRSRTKNHPMELGGRSVIRLYGGGGH